MRRTKNAASVWIAAWGIDQSGERHREGGFLSCSGSSEVVPVNSFAGAAAGGTDAAAGVGAGAGAGAAFFEGSACNASSWVESCDYCSRRPHAGSAPAENSRVLGP